jgi:hypothetical protein
MREVTDVVVHIHSALGIILSIWWIISRRRHLKERLTWMLGFVISQAPLVAVYIHCQYRLELKGKDGDEFVHGD